MQRNTSSINDDTTSLNEVPRLMGAVVAIRQNKASEQDFKTDLQQLQAFQQLRQDLQAA